MVLILKEGSDKKELKNIEEKFWKNKASGFNARKYNGTLKLKGNALEIQKRLRN